MEYINKRYDIITDKPVEETKILTISDLHWNFKLQKEDIDDLIIQINDYLPNYIFLLGDICTYNDLQDYDFKKTMLYFFKLLVLISKTYIVFGNHDYINSDTDKRCFVDVNRLLDFYDKTGVQVINNDIITENNLNIIGFNKNPETYADELCNIETLEQEIYSLMQKINSSLNEENFSILLTHSHLDLLKLQKELLEKINLILAGHTHDGLVPYFLKKIFPKNTSIMTGNKFFVNNTRGDFIQDDKIFIINGGVTKISAFYPKWVQKMTKNFYKSELDFIKIKTILTPKIDLKK